MSLQGKVIKGLAGDDDQLTLRLLSPPPPRGTSHSIFARLLAFGMDDAMHQRVAARAQGNKILFRIFARMAPKLLMMNF